MVRTPPIQKGYIPMTPESKEFKQRIMNRFKVSDYGTTGALEAMQQRIRVLEHAMAHLIAFCADRWELSPEEIDNEDGIDDF